MFEVQRPSWDEYFMDLARLAARRATCPVRQVGSVFVDSESKIVLSTGFNGSPRGMKHCGAACFEREHGQNQGLCKAVHSEANAIASAARMGTKLEGTHLYCTLSPCLNCARLLIQVGVSSITYAESSVYPEPLEELKEANILLVGPTG